MEPDPDPDTDGDGGRDSAPDRDGVPGDPRDLVRTYYDALDDGDYDALRGALAPAFVQRRPDRTFEGRDEFVRFMREDRPRTDTTHAVDRVYVDSDGEGAGEGRGGNESGGDGSSETTELAVRGRLLVDAAGDERDELAAFLDVFRVEGGRLVELRTYTQ